MRMNTTLVINPKGGSGKTTVTTSLASYFASKSVAVTPRVVRCRRRAPRRCSMAATALVAVGWVMPNSAAAFEKLPVSTMRMKRATAAMRSMGPDSALQAGRYSALE